MIIENKLIVFEGPDGVGKSAISRKLYEFLKSSGVDCEYLTFPGESEGSLGKHIYQLHHDSTLFGVTSMSPASLQTLHVAAHIDSIYQQIVPLLQLGKTIVLDRFWWSTFVYGKVAGVELKLLDHLIQLELSAWGTVKPDVLFLLSRNRPLRKEPLRRWGKLCSAYEDLADQERNSYPVKVVNNDGQMDDSIEKIVHTFTSIGWNAVLHSDGRNKRNLDSSALLCFKSLAPAKETIVYDTYWRFAAERQSIFFKRLSGSEQPWTDDRIIREYKFTNCYRASDRVSQYLIRNVIYAGDQNEEELLFRILLFKLFNKIETWEILKTELGEIRFSDYSRSRYDKILSRALTQGQAIYSAAYIMPSGGRTFQAKRKHQAHLMLLERMMEDEVAFRLCESRGMYDVFRRLRSYPMLGDFLAYQFATDINYSNLTNFSEMEFVVPGPGALDGIKKCFSDLGGLNEQEMIKVVADRQEEEFERLGVAFRSLWGRRLQLIDCQNIFCEVAKYSRLRHPEVVGTSGRTRIKQRFRPGTGRIDYWYPPKWGLNKLVKEDS